MVVDAFSQPLGQVAVLDVPGLLQIFSSPVTPDSLLTADTSGEVSTLLC